MNKNILTGLGVAGALVGIFFAFYLVIVFTIAAMENTDAQTQCEWENGTVVDSKRTGNRYITDPWSGGTSGYCELKK